MAITFSLLIYAEGFAWGIVCAYLVIKAMRW